MQLHFLSRLRQRKNVIPMSFVSCTLSILSALIFSMLFFSCSDEGELDEFEIDCKEIAYSDTIFYQRPGQNFTVSPLNDIEGVFSVVPNGLAIDAATGLIDINASETGLRYKVLFTPSGSNQVCETFITIGGVNYLDGVYVLNQNQLIASPVYNGIVGLPLPCPDDDDDDDDDDDSSCKFDADNPEGELLKDLGFEISSKGDFDLKKTVENGTFGSTPVNGRILDVDLYYQLPDLSGLALNRIPLRFFYYNKLSDVPKAVLDDIAEKRKLINEVDAGNYSNFRTLETIRPKGKPRPPYVVIVATLQ
jgi:hypothetical protein